MAKSDRSKKRRSRPPSVRGGNVSAHANASGKKKASKKAKVATAGSAAVRRRTPGLREATPSLWRRCVDSVAAKIEATGTPAAIHDESFVDAILRWKWALLAAFLLGLYVYWPTILWMAENWESEPDYGHGWIVAPIAGIIAMRRSDLYPGTAKTAHWMGAGLIVLAILMRLVGRLIYADFLDAYSILPMIAGGVWCLFGLRAMLWSLPAIGFLLFAVPLPYRAESLLSFQLQGIATKLSTVLLTILGQPAAAEGNVIWLGDEKLQI
ncbi:MAG: exosortase/archaeosortase family protein, partial [Planctomycetota bacterium]